jgi:hypothetical protein
MSTSDALALRHVARTPLILTMALLWLIGAAQLLARLPDGVLRLQWPIGAALAALTALLLLGSQRLLQLASISVVLGLAATLAFSHQLGIGGLVGAGTVAAAYALIVWHAATGALAHPASGRPARWLRLAGGHGQAGGRALLESAAHWSGAAVCLVVLALVPLAFAARSHGLVPEQPWPMLVLAGAFFFLAGWRYHHRWHCYAFLVSVLFGVWLACASVAAPGAGVERLLASPALALWTVAFSIVLSTVALAIDRGEGGATLELARTLYREPARAFALALALAVVVHQAANTGLALAFGADTPDALVALLAGAAMLLANHARARFVWSLLGVLVIWLALYRFAIDLLVADWPALRQGDAAHHGLVLAALALALASTARVLRRYPAGGARYVGPLHLNAALAFAAALVFAAAALAGPAPGGPVLASAMALLVAGAIPVLAALPAADHWRGLALPVLLTGLVATLFGVPDLALAGAGRAAFAWGFVLWLCGSLLVGRWNRRLPEWSVSEAAWPWFGLAFVLAGAATLARTPDTLWLGLAGLSAYLFLLIRNSAWIGFPWLAAAALTAAGLALAGWWTAPLTEGRWQPLTAATMFASLAWLNLLLAAIPVWRRRGPALAEWLGWRRNDLERPLLAGSATALLATLGALAAIEGLWVLGAAPPFDASASLGLATMAQSAIGLSAIGLSAMGLALAASFLHANRVEPGLVFAQAFLVALLAAVISALMLFLDPRHVPLAIALWGTGLLAVSRQRARTESPSAFARALDSAVGMWVRTVPVAAAALAVLVPALSVSERLVVLAVVLAHVAGIGWWQQRRQWLAVAALLALGLEHAIWLLWLPAAELDRALPWYALTGAANVWLLLWLTARLERALAPGPGVGGESRHASALALRGVLGWALPVVLGLIMLELAAHFIWVAGSVAVNLAPRWLSGADAFAALASWALLIGLSVRTAHRRQQGRWIYAAALLGGAAALYLRVVTVGLTPPGILDTAVLIGAAYALFAVQRLTLSTPTMHVCLVLPLIALATLPAQLGSMHAGAALMAIAVLYLLIRGRTLNPIPLYLGVLAINASVYLWIPLWADRFGMFQLYVMPAAISVLVLVHLHRRELKPSVLNGARLASLVTLYCGAALDVFAHPSLAMFALALALSLASVVVGIALRIRAFMYAGVAFLVLNVGYQLVQLYPEQRLGRAVLLIALGIAITGGMIGFNIKREAIMRRIQIFRADLDTWE